MSAFMLAYCIYDDLLLHTYQCYRAQSLYLPDICWCWLMIFLPFSRVQCRTFFSLPQSLIIAIEIYWDLWFKHDTHVSQNNILPLIPSLSTYLLSLYTTFSTPKRWVAFCLFHSSVWCFFLRIECSMFKCMIFSRFWLASRYSLSCFFLIWCFKGIYVRYADICLYNNSSDMRGCWELLTLLFTDIKQYCLYKCIPCSRLYRHFSIMIWFYAE